MKKVLLFLASICLLQITYAQNYEPYLFGKTYRYLYLNKTNPYSAYQDSTVFYQRIDTLIVENNKDSIFESEKKEYVRGLTDFATNIHFRNYIKKGSVYTFYSIANNGGTENKEMVYKINNQSRIGDTSYLGRNCFSTYKSLTYQTFLGVSDSVKVFEIRKQNENKDSLIGEILLSKNYGFINVIQPDYRSKYFPYVRLAESSLTMYNHTYYFANLFSIKEFNLGYRQPKPYRMTLGDTMVFGTISSAGTPPCLKPKMYIYSTENERDMSIYFVSNYTFDFETIKLGKYEGIKGGGIEGDNSIYAENIGLKEQTYSGEGKSCIDGLLFYKGAAGEFGDRKQLDKLLSIDDLEINTQVHISPNPSSGEIKFNFHSEENKQIIITDLLGREVKNFTSSEKEIVINLPIGFYMVKVKINDKVIVNKVQIN